MTNEDGGENPAIFLFGKMQVHQDGASDRGDPINYGDGR
jgi:hypothetical protein